MRTVVAAAAAALMLVVLAACGEGSPSAALVTTRTTRPAAATATTSAAPATTATIATTEAPPSSTTTAATAPATTAKTAPPTTAAPTPTAPDARLSQVGNATQAIVVRATSYGATTATFTAWERNSTSGPWKVAFGPWPAFVGYNGFAPPGEKREGDGRTPSGTYGFQLMFGVSPDPGVQFEYRQVEGANIVWDDDPTSPTYNEWVDLNEHGGGTDPEGLYQPVAYQYAAVIAYNTARTPGLGSGIFLHASKGNPTAGCVSLPVDRLVSVLRWMDPAQSPRISMGVG